MLELTTLNDRQDLARDSKSGKAYSQLEVLLQELRKRTLPDKIVLPINKEIMGVNASLSTENELGKTIKQHQTRILKLLEQDLKIVPKNHYRNLWLAVGMAAFGLPIGVIIGTSTGNIGLLAIGLPIGMLVGAAVGAGMDKKAFKERRQLDVEIK